MVEVLSHNAPTPGEPSLHYLSYLHVGVRLVWGYDAPWLIPLKASIR